MKSKTHGKPVKTFAPYKSAAALLLLAALAAAVAIFISGGTDTVRAFTLGERITDLEFDLHNNNANAGGIAAEGGHLYAADRTGDKMYAYRKSPSDLSTHGDHSSSLDFDLHSSNQDPWGVWNYQQWAPLRAGTSTCWTTTTARCTSTGWMRTTPTITATG